MKKQVFLGWLAELEAIGAGGGHWLDDVLVAAMRPPRPETVSAAPSHDHLRVFAALAATALREAAQPLSQPS